MLKRSVDKETDQLYLGIEKSAYFTTNVLIMMKKMQNNYMIERFDDICNHCKKLLDDLSWKHYDDLSNIDRSIYPDDYISLF